jgi:putative membrane protein
MTFFYIKALHIIFIVTWFAGLFYIVRLFVYFAETAGMAESEKKVLQNQYKIMQKRLWYGITWPSMVLTLIFGPWMLIEIPGYLQQPWMHLKLTMVLGLIIYQFICHKIFKEQQQGVIKMNSFKLRLWNEVATLFLISIVFIVVFKDTLSWLYGLLGLIVFAILLMISINLYKKRREKSN